MNDKLSYWDLKIRTLASKALHELTELDTDYMLNSVLPILINRCQSQSVFERHGALCGIAQIITALNAANVEFPAQIQKHIKMIIPKLEKNRGYRGRGGERVREQCCRVMEALCNAQFTLSDKGINRYQESIDENLRIPQEFVQDAAVSALRALTTYYHNDTDANDANKRCSKITQKWCTELNKEIIASVTRGYSRGLGVLNKNLILPHLKQVIDSLIRKSLITEQEDTRDYETRKFCCIALADLCQIIGVSEQYEYEWSPQEDENDEKNNDSDDDDDDELRKLGIDIDVTKERHQRIAYQKKITDEKFEFMFDTKGDESSMLYDRIVGALVMRFEDYEVDRRGDVGSFVREHNLMQMFRVMVVLAKAGKKSDGKTAWLRPKLPTLILNHILRQLSEKLDRVRRAAGKVIELIFDSEDADIQRIVFEDDAQIRSIFAGHGGLDWSAPSEVFPLLVKALDLESYRRSIIEGLLQSVGCINSTMSRLTLETLEPYMNGLADNNMKGQLIAIGNDLIYCLKKRHLNRLFMIPFLKGIGILLSEKVYFEPLQNDKENGTVFAAKLHAQLKKECYKSTDILKLLTSIKVFIGLALFEETRERALQRLMVFLGYQYPALRKQTCLELSSAIAAFGDKIIKNEEKQNAAFDYLSTNVWGGLDLEAVRAQRNECFDMFGIKPPKLKGLKKKKAKRKVEKKDDDEL